MDIKTDEERLQRLLKKSAIIKSGYGGIDKNGSIVDRREVPDAVPMMKNSLLDIPAPKPLIDISTNVSSNIL